MVFLFHMCKQVAGQFAHMTGPKTELDTGETRGFESWLLEEA